MSVNATIIGTVVKTPETNYTAGGKAVATLNIGATPAYKNREGRWEQIGDPLYIQHTLWEQDAEGAAETFPKGTQIVITNAQLALETFTTRQGRTGQKIKTTGKAKIAVAPKPGQNAPAGHPGGEEGAGADHNPWAEKANPWE